MATYPTGYINQFVQTPGYKPDWQFLTQVMGTKQAEYDRGFNMVKSLYNSTLNNPLTSADNERYRTEMFKKLQNSLKSVSGVDLSNPTNIIKAKDLIKPLSEDQELIYDMSVTSHHAAQRSLADSYKNSTDTKIRSQYNDWSIQDMAFAQEDLKNAKRGDGSIMKVAPRDFVPFEDVNEYLDKAAKDADLKIVTSRTDPSGYILKQTNGDAAEIPFTEWAKGKLGTRFDRQFDVMGRVTAEGKIRNMMKDKGLSREDALGTISTEMSTKAIDEYNKSLTVYDDNLKSIESRIGIIKRKFPNGFNTNPNVKAEYDKLVNARDIYKERVKDSMGQLERLQKDGSTYYIDKLPSIFAERLKNDTASGWGTARAEATSELDITADQAAITKWNIASREKIANAQLAFNYQKLEQDRQFKVADVRAKLATAKAKGEAPGETYVTQYTSTAEWTAADQLGAETESYRSNLFNNAFGSESGLINMVVDPKEHNKYFTVLAKVKALSAGQGSVLNAEDFTVLNNYAKAVGTTVKNPYNKETANDVLDLLAGQTYYKASENVKTYSKIGATREARKSLDSFKEALKNMQMITDAGEQLFTSYKNIADVITDANGNLKSGYENAKLIKRAGDGTPIYDLSGVDIEYRKALENVIGTQFRSKTRPYGSTYDFTGITPAEIQNIFNSKASISTSEGSKIDVAELSKLGYGDLQKLFGDRAKVDFDPITKTAIMQFSVSPTEGIAKAMGLKTAQTISVNIPYESINASRGALSRLQKYIPANSISNRTLGLFNKFAANPNSRITADSYMKNIGFDYDIAGVMNTNGSYGLGININFLNPWSGKQESLYQFQPVDQGNPDSYANAEDYINTMFTNYMVQRAEHESLFDNDELTAYAD